MVSVGLIHWCSARQVYARTYRYSTFTGSRYKPCKLLFILAEKTVGTSINEPGICVQLITRSLYFSCHSLAISQFWSLVCKEFFRSCLVIWKLICLDYVSLLWWTQQVWQLEVTKKLYLLSATVSLCFVYHCMNFSYFWRIWTPRWYCKLCRMEWFNVACCLV